MTLILFWKIASSKFGYTLILLLCNNNDIIVLLIR